MDEMQEYRDRIGRRYDRRQIKNDRRHRSRRNDKSPIDADFWVCLAILVIFAVMILYGR